MKTYVFPAFCRHVDTGGFSIDFPDLPGCVSTGDTVEEAMTMAREALSLHLHGFIEDSEPIPAPSDLLSIKPETDAFLALVEGRLDIIRDMENIRLGV